MITKAILNSSIQTLDYSDDLSAIRRLLIAATISPRFCADLLENPSSAIRQGFGGEKFPLSESTRNIVSSIQASTLGDFIQQINDFLPVL